MARPKRETLPRPPAIEPQPAFGEKLKTWRESVRWSREKLALVLGVSPIQVTRWEPAEERSGRAGRPPSHAPTLKAGERYEAFRQGDLSSAVEERIAELEKLLAELRETKFRGSA